MPFVECSAPSTRAADIFFRISVIRFRTKGVRKHSGVFRQESRSTRLQGTHLKRFTDKRVFRACRSELGESPVARAFVGTNRRSSSPGSPSRVPLGFWLPGMYSNHELDKILSSRKLLILQVAEGVKSIKSRGPVQKLYKTFQASFERKQPYQASILLMSVCGGATRVIKRQAACRAPPPSAAPSKNPNRA